MTPMQALVTFNLLVDISAPKKKKLNPLPPNSPTRRRHPPGPFGPKPHPSKPHPCNMPQAKTEVALQFSECCAAETALQHWLFCSAEVIWTKSCAAANEKLHCNIEKAALQESGAFLPLSCGFQAPTFRHPRLGLAIFWGFLIFSGSPVL